MPKYYVSATVYATYEYKNGVEIEASSAEEAGQKFEELVAQRGSGVIDLSQPIDKAFDIEGFYRVIVVSDGMSVDDMDDNEPEIDSQPFSVK